MTTTAWHNRIVGYGEERPDDLLANPLNHRVHTAEQQRAFLALAKRHGIIQNVILNKRTNYLIDGHMRVQLASRTNQPTVPVTYVDVSPDEEGVFITAFDWIGAQAGIDNALLDEALRHIQADDADVQELLARIAEDTGLIPALDEPFDESHERPLQQCPNCGHEF